MSFDPGYGETPLPFEELDALLPEVRDILGEPISKAMVYDLEQSIEAEVTEALVTDVLEERLGLDILLTDGFIRDLHRRLYGDIWTWAGRYRTHPVNIGVEPAQVASELRGSLETIHYRWSHTDDWTGRELGIAVHADSVRIHPFVDGNGRTTRLLADLVFAAAQDGEAVELYDWQIEKARYVQLLRAYDVHRDPTDLAAFIPTYELR